MPARLLIRNGFVASLDRRLGRLSDCVLLVEDGLIAAVGRGLDAGDAEVIDASGTIVLPGFVDTRRHLWQTNVRGVLPSCTLDQYMASVMFGFGSVYRPKDVLRFATTAGAAACGLDDKIGTLAPRKQADVILVRADAVNTFPVVDPIGTVVASADTWNVDTVLVRGEVRKHGGRLIGVDRRTALRDQVQRSATTSYTLRTPRPHGWARHPGRRQRPGNG